MFFDLFEDCFATALPKQNTTIRTDIASTVPTRRQRILLSTVPEFIDPVREGVKASFKVGFGIRQNDGIPTESESATLPSSEYCSQIYGFCTAAVLCLLVSTGVNS
jgi:hypothetical protein